MLIHNNINNSSIIICCASTSKQEIDFGTVLSFKVSDLFDQQ